MTQLKLNFICNVLGTGEGKEAVGILWEALVANYLLIRAVKGTVAATGAAGVAVWLGGTVEAAPAQTHTAPEACWEKQEHNDMK